MQGDECQRQEKLVQSARNRPKHNARNMRNIRTLKECLLQVRGLNLQKQNYTKLTGDESRDEGLYNELKAWNSPSSS